MHVLGANYLPKAIGHDRLLLVSSWQATFLSW